MGKFPRSTGSGWPPMPRPVPNPSNLGPLARQPRPCNSSFQLYDRQCKESRVAPQLLGHSHNAHSYVSSIHSTAGHPWGIPASCSSKRGITGDPCETSQPLAHWFVSSSVWFVTPVQRWVGASCCAPRRHALERNNETSPVGAGKLRRCTALACEFARFRREVAGPWVARAACVGVSPCFAWQQASPT